MHAKAIVGMSVLLLIGIPGLAFGQNLTPLEELGQFMYFDENLSTPPGQSCASCHHPDAGFADPDQNLPVSQGIIAILFGNRNSPSSAYAAFSPDFHWNLTDSMYIGGQFWDGRALDLVEQAKGPFLNPLEMHNNTKKQVIKDVWRADYADLFREVFGESIFENIDAAYDSMAVAIGAFEEASVLNQFTSKFDYYLQGLATFTEQESLGLALFNDEEAGNCAACHPSEPGPYADDAVFTDYSYDNLGIPKNWGNPFLYLPHAFNPLGDDFVDYGLGAIVGEAGEMGKFKVMTLRNIAATAPYGHNGFFETLEEIVDFYNTRDVPGAGWDPPEVPENMNTEELGDLGLNDDEVNAIVAFLETLTDGYVPTGNVASASISANLITAAPSAFALNQNYPNPFNPATTIHFVLPEHSHAKLTVLDVQGRTVATLVDGWREAGAHEVTFDARGLASGVYLYKLEAGQKSASGKLVLLK